MNTDTQNSEEGPYTSKSNAFKTLLDKIYFHRLPSYGNKIFFGLGFLALTSLAMLVVTGITLAFMGQHWWLTNPWGVFFRSVHLWSVQAFITVLILHFLVGMFTSGFKPPRRMVWVFGATIFCLALIQTEFGYGLRGDFASQYRAVSGADFWNGAYLGHWLNPLNLNQTFILHVAILPLLIFGLFIAHYLLEHTYGISKPYRKDIKYRMANADHKIMYARGGVLVALILMLAALFPSPYVPAVTIKHVAQTQPTLVATTLVQEIAKTSDTATYLDSIDPYTFDTSKVFVGVPYEKIHGATGGYDAWKAYESASPAQQKQDITQANTELSASSTEALSSSAGATSTSTATNTNPVVAVIGTLLPAAKSGLYTALINDEKPSINYTYNLRFLNDMDVLHDQAKALNMDTEQWGMAKDDTGSIWKLPPGSWWLAPLGALNSAFDLPDNPNGDRIAAETLGVVMLLFIFFPYIPYVNRIPELFHLAPFIWKDKELEKEDDVPQGRVAHSKW